MELLEIDGDNLMNMYDTLASIIVAGHKGDWAKARAQLTPLGQCMKKIVGISEACWAIDRLTEATNLIIKYGEPRNGECGQTVTTVLQAQTEALELRRNNLVLKMPAVSSLTMQ